MAVELYLFYVAERDNKKVLNIFLENEECKYPTKYWWKVVSR
jgi:hypothetical protein